MWSSLSSSRTSRAPANSPSASRSTGASSPRRSLSKSGTTRAATMLPPPPLLREDVAAPDRWVELEAEDAPTTIPAPPPSEIRDTMPCPVSAPPELCAECGRPLSSRRM